MGRNSTCTFLIVFLALPLSLFAQGSLLSFDFLSDQGGRCFSQFAGQGFKNPAVLSENKAFTFSLLSGSSPVWKSYSENAVQAIVPLKKENLALAYAQSGRAGYMERKILFAFSKKLNPRWETGLAFQGLALRLGEEYGKSFLFGTTLGIRYRVNQRWSFASLMQWSYPEKDNTRPSFFIPALFSQGLHCQLNNNSSVYLEVEKGNDDYTIIRSGLLYGIHSKVQLLGNVSYKQFVQSTLGVQLLFSANWQLNLSFRHHPYLGIQSMIGLSYNYWRK